MPSGSARSASPRAAISAAVESITGTAGKPTSWASIQIRPSRSRRAERNTGWLASRSRNAPRSRSGCIAGEKSARMTML